MMIADTATTDRVRRLVITFLDEIAKLDPGSPASPSGVAALHSSTAAQVVLEGLMMRHREYPLATFQGFGVGIGVDLAKFENDLAALRAVDLIYEGLNHGLRVGAEALRPKGSA